MSDTTSVRISPSNFTTVLATGAIGPRGPQGVPGDNVLTDIMLNIKDFGSNVGTGGDDTDAIQATYKEAGELAVGMTPPGSTFMQSSPIVLWPFGKYNIEDSIKSDTVGTAYSRTLGCDAIVEQHDPTKEIFDFRHTNRFEIENIQGIGGKNFLLWGNRNIDGSQGFLSRCEFHNTEDWAIDTYLGPWGVNGEIPPVNNLSANLILDRCKFWNNKRLLRNVEGLRAVLIDSWIRLRGTTAFNGAQFENRNELILVRPYAVPPSSSTPANIHWVDNYGQYYSQDARFGGEDGGIYNVNNYAGPATTYPYVLGGAIVIKNGYMAIGPASRTRTIINLSTALPQLLHIEDVIGITMDNGTWMIDNIPGGLQNYLDELLAISANIVCHVKVDNNVSFGTNLDPSYGCPPALTTNPNVICDFGATMNQVTIASADTINLPQRISHPVARAYITGTTDINTITASGTAGLILILKFEANLTVGDSSVPGNLRLEGIFNSTSDDSLVLLSNGSTWTEISRSHN